VITLDIATNLLSSAVWELAIKPLYRSGAAVLTTPARRRARQLDEAISRAAAGLAGVERDPDVPPAFWAALLGSDEVRTLVQDLFVFTLEETRPSTGGIRRLFVTTLSDAAHDHGLRRGAIDAEAVFDQISRSTGAILNAAIAANVLAAHEIKSVARHRVVEARLEAIEQQVRSPTPPASSAEYETFEEQLRAEVALRYSKLEPPNLLGRERVPLERLFVPPLLSAGTRGDEDQTVALGTFISTIDRRVTLGNPGAGKSTLAAKVCHDLARDYGRRPVNSRHRTPWSVELRRFAGTPSGARTSLVEYFSYWARASYQLQVPDGAFDWLLSRGRLLVVFDGLDELLDTSLRQDVRNEVESFCRRYPSAPVLVTSRRVGYHQAPLDEDVFDTVELRDFDEERVERYAAQWFDLRLADEPSDDRRAHTQRFISDSSVAGELRNNPLLLALLASLHRGPGSIPKNLPDVYDSCASLLFSTWDKHRGINAVLPFAEHVRPALRELAWWLFTTPSLSGGVTRPQAVAQTAAYLGQRRFGDPDRARAAAEDFVDFCRGRAWVFTDQGSTAAGEDLFGFTHRTFLEFFAAEHLAFRKQSAEDLVAELVPHIAKEQWDVVALIALQIKARSYPDGADDVVTALLDAARSYRGSELLAVVAFMLRLLRSAIPSPRITRQLGGQIFIFAAREAYQKSHQANCALLGAMATVGSEISDEFATGIASAQRRLLGDRSTVRSRIGSELIFHSGDLVGHSPFGNDRATRFWEGIGDHVVKQYGDAVRDAAGRDVEVGRDAWPTLITTRELLDSHGAVGVLGSRSSRFARSPRTDPPLRQLLTAIRSPAGGIVSRDQAWCDVVLVASYLVARPAPWLTVATPGLIALCAADLSTLARSSRGRLSKGTAAERFAIWLVAALAVEELRQMGGYGGAGPDGTEVLLTGMQKSRDAFFVGLRGVLLARIAPAGRGSSPDISSLCLEGAQSEFVHAWVGDREQLLSFV
jgi:hypothetical protein